MFTEEKGMEIWLNDRVLALHVQGPGFTSCHQRNKAVARTKWVNASGTGRFGSFSIYFQELCLENWTSVFSQILRILLMLFICIHNKFLDLGMQ